VTGSQALTNEHFIMASGQGPVDYELDVCARLDTTVYVVECKAGTLTEAARRGAEHSVKSDLVDLLAGAQRQTARAIESFRADAVDLSRLRDFAAGAEEFIPVIVTLDHTGSMTTDIETVREQPFGRAPWIVSLLDLYTLADLLEKPWRFKHYVRRRIDVLRDDRTVIAFDELDIYETYRRFNVCAFPPGGSHTVFVVPTNDIDLYYAALPGRGVRKPTRKVPRPIGELISDLESCGATGWTDVACDYLDLNHATQAHLSRSMRRMQAQAALGAELSISRLYDDRKGRGWAYCAIAGIPDDDTMMLAHAYLIDRVDDVPKWLIVIHDPAAKAVMHGVYERVDGKMVLSGRSLRVGEDALTMRPMRRPKSFAFDEQN